MLRTPEQRAAVERRAHIFATGIPGCWSWPDTRPTEQDARRKFLARTAGPPPKVTELLWRAEQEIGLTDGSALLHLWQDGRRAICEEDHNALVTDHGHATGLARGLLCRSCNTREGLNHRPGTVFARYRGTAADHDPRPDDPLPGPVHRGLRPARPAGRRRLLGRPRDRRHRPVTTDPRTTDHHQEDGMPETVAGRCAAAHPEDPTPRTRASALGRTTP